MSSVLTVEKRPPRWPSTLRIPSITSDTPEIPENPPSITISKYRKLLNIHVHWLGIAMGDEIQLSVVNPSCHRLVVNVVIIHSCDLEWSKLASLNDSTYYLIFLRLIHFLYCYKICCTWFGLAAVNMCIGERQCYYINMTQCSYNNVPFWHPRRG